MSRSLFGNDLPSRNSNGGVGQHAHLTFRGNARKGRFSWLRLTPAYSLHLVQEILRDCSSHDLVLDPFSGTATTTLLSASVGVKAHSVDINPFLVWLGNLKVSTITESASASATSSARRIVAALRRRRSWKGAWTPDLHQIEKWWDQGTLDVLSQLFAAISRSETHGDAQSPDLLRIAFCRVMMQHSNASFGHQSMSFKKKDTRSQLPLFSERGTGTRVDELCSAFLRSVDDIADDARLAQPLASAHVYLGDARDLEHALPARGYTRVVTSPPYPNRMSYIRELRPYMYWLGYLTNGRQAGELDWRAIGGTWGCATSNLGTWKPADDAVIPYPQFEAVVSRITRDHPLLGRYVHKYFEDIQVHLRSLRLVLAPAARCYYVVGNSKFYSTLLPVEEIYAALLQDAGFVNCRIETLRKRSSKKELYEYVVYAEAPPDSPRARTQSRRVPQPAAAAPCGPRGSNVGGSRS